MALKCRSDHWQKQSLNSDLLNTHVIGLKQLMLEALLAEPLADGARDRGHGHWSVSIHLLVRSGTHEGSDV